MALTLVEAAKLYEDPVAAGIVAHFAANAPMTSRLPLVDIVGNSYAYNREESMPGVGFRGINESYTESTGVINPQSERLVIAGGDLDVDRFIVKTMGSAQRTTQEMLKAKALAHAVEKKIIKGDSATDPREFDGLQARLTGDQLVDAGSTDGGDALSLAKLDELIDTVDNPTALYMTAALRRRFDTAARSSSVSGNINYQQDQFGRRQMFYAELPIVVTGFDETNSLILDFDEVGSGGSTATATSIYCVSEAEEKVCLLQNGRMEVTDLGELQTAPVYRTRLEWYVTQAVFHGRAAARLRGISNAAITA